VPQPICAQRQMKKRNRKKRMRLSGHGRIEEKLNEIWRVLLDVCDEHKVAADVIINWKLHRDRLSVAKRFAVLRALRAQGWYMSDLRRLCPMSERGLRKIAPKIMFPR
jgi:hypothetical protein